jgi:hypothetical protein
VFVYGQSLMTSMQLSHLAWLGLQREKQQAGAEMRQRRKREMMTLYVIYVYFNY